MASKGSSLRDRQIGRQSRPSQSTRHIYYVDTDSLRVASIKKILNLNEAVNASENDEPHANGTLASTAPILNADGEPIWKVLVFDDLGRDVISSVLRVSDLRSMGITMHM